MILSIGPTSKACKKEGNVFYHVYKRFFYFGDTNAFLTFFLNFFLTFITSMGKATDFKFDGYIYRANPNKSPLKILWRKESVGVSRDCLICGYPPLSQERVKIRTSNFVGTFIALIETKAGENVGNSAVGVVRESRKFSVHPYVGLIARSSLR